jgi:hypothetical protein
MTPPSTKPPADAGVSGDSGLHPEHGIYAQAYKTIGAFLSLLDDVNDDRVADGAPLQRALLFPLGLDVHSNAPEAKLYWIGKDSLPDPAPLMTRGDQIEALTSVHERLVALAHLYRECSRRIHRMALRAERAKHALENTWPPFYAKGQEDVFYQEGGPTRPERRAAAAGKEA